MNTEFLRAPAGSQLLAALIHQTQVVAQFVETERHASEIHAQLTGSLEPALYQAGGLLNDAALQPLFANPLPDAPLQAASENYSRASLSLSVAEPHARAPQRRATAGAGEPPPGSQQAQNGRSAASTNRNQATSSQARARAQTQTAEMTNKPVGERRSAQRDAGSVDVGQAVERRLDVLQTRTKPVDDTSNVAQTRRKPANAQAQPRLTVAATVAVVADGDEAAAATGGQHQSQDIRKNTAQAPQRRSISAQQAASVLQLKWQRQGWNSSLHSGTQEASAEALRPASKPVKTPPSDAIEDTTQNRLATAVARILKGTSRTSGASRGQSALQADRVGHAPMAGPAITENQYGRAPSLLGAPRLDPANAMSFTPAPPAPQAQQKQVGLRGLAARVGVHEAAAADAANGDPGRAAQHESPHAGYNGLPAHTADSAAELAAMKTSGGAITAAELAELITQEAKRAGINLEQFQP